MAKAAKGTARKPGTRTAAKGEFQVHGSAAVRKPKGKPAKSQPVVTVRANPEALKFAHARARGQDMHVVVLRDGTVEIRNGARL